MVKSLLYNVEAIIVAEASRNGNKTFVLLILPKDNTFNANAKIKNSIIYLVYDTSTPTILKTP